MLPGTSARSACETAVRIRAAGQKIGRITFADDINTARWSLGYRDGAANAVGDFVISAGGNLDQDRRFVIQNDGRMRFGASGVMWSGRVTVQPDGVSTDFIIPKYFVGHLYVHGFINQESAVFVLGCDQQGECVVEKIAQNLEANLSLRRIPGSGYYVWQFTGASTPGNLHYALVGMAPDTL